MNEPDNHAEGGGPVSTFNPDDLTAEQLAGVACVYCHQELILSPAVQVGTADGYGAVYACADECRN